jgi:hypothetical protein
VEPHRHVQTPWCLHETGSQSSSTKHCSLRPPGCHQGRNHHHQANGRGYVRINKGFWCTPSGWADQIQTNLHPPNHLTASPTLNVTRRPAAHHHLMLLSLQLLLLLLVFCCPPLCCVFPTGNKSRSKHQSPLPSPRNLKATAAAALTPKPGRSPRPGYLSPRADVSPRALGTTAAPCSAAAQAAEVLRHDGSHTTETCRSKTPSPRDASPLSAQAGTSSTTAMQTPAAPAAAAAGGGPQATPQTPAQGPAVSAGSSQQQQQQQSQYAGTMRPALARPAVSPFAVASASPDHDMDRDDSLSISLNGSYGTSMQVR